MGNVQQTAQFRQRYRLPFVCLADPDLIAYRAYGVPRATFGQVAGPQVWAKGLRAAAVHGGGRPIGDVFQLQGTFVIDRQGILRLVHRPDSSADHPSHDQLIAELEKLQDRAAS